MVTFMKNVLDTLIGLVFIFGVGAGGIFTISIIHQELRSLTQERLRIGLSSTVKFTEALLEAEK